MKWNAELAEEAQKHGTPLADTGEEYNVLNAISELVGDGEEEAPAAADKAAKEAEAAAIKAAQEKAAQEKDIFQACCQEDSEKTLLYGSA